MDLPKAVIIRDAPYPPREEMKEELSMDDFTVIEEDTPTSEGDNIPQLPQLPPQEENVEASVPIRTSSKRWSASAKALESREQESLNLNKAYSAVQE